MYCPLCGGELEFIPNTRETEEIDDWGREDLDEVLARNEAIEAIRRDEYRCIGRGCFRVDYPLYHHQPFQGIDSAPGDSWSLSWIK